jgi:hypothetical protein
MSHVEFPKLTPEARAAFDAAIDAIRNDKATISCADLSRAFAAFLREVLKQAGLRSNPELGENSITAKLFAIANNLHNPPPPPPPPPPTLAEARAADLETQEGIEAVRDFPAFLGEGTQS